jgi:hypothetical protein
MCVAQKNKKIIRVTVLPQCPHVHGMVLMGM